MAEPSAPEWSPKKRNAAFAIPRARRLRQEMTLQERRLWEEARKRKLSLRRQAPVGRYVVDFVSHAGKLVIEIDGYYHTLEANRCRDAERDAWLSGQGYRVLRFTDRQCQDDLGQVLVAIEAALRPAAEQAEPSPPSPTLPPSRGKGEE